MLATMISVLVVDEDEALRQALAVAAARAGCEAVAMSTVAGAREELMRRTFDVVLATLGEGVDLVEELRSVAPRTQVIAMTATPELALAAMRAGAADAFVLPLRLDDAVLALARAEERERSWRARESRPDASVRESAAPTEIVAHSPRMDEVVRVARKIAPFNTTVLVTGESGTGKELIARSLHAWSTRAAMPFVPINCAAIPEGLLESELFGHKKGAFTDAHKDKAGLFEEASGGTLFLDEIGDLPLSLQVKLLRVLQEQEIRPLGSTVDIKVDVRVIAATVRNLVDDVAAGRFREDLFYRLHVLPVHLPPLRERREEIPQLVENFIARFNRKLGTRITGCSAEALQLLTAHAWPGNVRELENTIERAMVLAEGDQIDAGGLPEKVRAPTDKLRMTMLGSDLSIKKATRIIEEELIRRALKETRGNRTSAARILEISHRALLYKIKEFGIADVGKPPT